MSTAIAFENVSKTFDVNGKKFEALKNVSLTVDHGDIYGIVGYSGAGKSTLLRTVNALERPTSGRVVVDGQEINTLGEKDLSIARQRIGMIFQQFNLLYSRNVYKNIAYPLRLAGLPKDKIIDRVEELLDFVGLTDKALAYPSRLSGGQKQRVGIARALANSPDILISDEATSALDPQTTGEVLEVLQRVNRELGVTILLVTHEMDVIRKIANKVAVMENGSVIDYGTAYEVFSNPQSPTTQRFVASVLHHQPPSETITRIRSAHRGRLVQIHLENQESSDPFLSRAARNNGVDFTIVYGGVNELQGQLFGSLTVELLGTDAQIEATIADLRLATSVTEVPHA